MNWILKRAGEPSTRAGVAVALQVAKTVPVVAPYAALCDALTALLAGHLIVTPDKA